MQAIDLGGIELFCTPDRVAYAAISRGDRREVWPVRSDSFRRFAFGRVNERGSRSPRRDAEEWIDALEAQAELAGNVQEVHFRVAASGKDLCIDLANP